VELMFVAMRIGSDRFQYLEPITICGVIFLVLSLISAAGIRRVEARVGRQWLGKDRRAL
jgi:polar amino acid transport system permease protein